MKKVNTTKLILSLAGPFVAGFIGAAYTTPAIPGWYQNLAKPFFSPPNFLFGPVWTILYILMGLSLYLVWTSKDRNASIAVKFFWIHLIVNLGWSLAFFGLRSPVLGLVVIIALLVMIAYLIKIFSKIDKRAGRLLYPYIAWVSFATLLNSAIFILN